MPALPYEKPNTVVVADIAPPISGKSRSRIWNAVAAVAVVLVVVLVYVLSASPSSGGGTAGGLSSEQGAVSSAAPFANGITGGPWQLAWARGYLGGGPLNVWDVIPGAPPCVLHNGTVTSFPAPAVNGSYSLGYAEAWILEYVNPATGSSLALLVDGGAVAEMGEIRGPGCLLGSALPSGLTDSTTAAQAVGRTSNATAFVTAHPKANATYVLVNFAYLRAGTLTNASGWFVQFYASPSGPSSDFSAVVFANNGTVLCETLATLPCFQI